MLCLQRVIDVSFFFPFLSNFHQFLGKGLFFLSLNKVNSISQCHFRCAKHSNYIMDLIKRFYCHFDGITMHGMTVLQLSEEIIFCHISKDQITSLVTG